MLIQAISAGALFAVGSLLELQWILVVLIATVTLAFAVLVIWLIVHLVRRNPAYLFNPQDINPAVHGALYATQTDKIDMDIKSEDS